MSSKELSAEEIAIKHYPDADFEECEMSCMRCDNDTCESKTAARKKLQKDLESYAYQRLEAYKAELVEWLEAEHIEISKHLFKRTFSTNLELLGAKRTHEIIIDHLTKKE